ncbi:AMIN domain-containing protein [Helicobacter aurati]|uniref:AMIN domain-containing protein n=1 Tax=Helicobacter aurati TaxID=137778 RepID=A0A3D8IZB4_9HELI|nr:AMIN domain-containing protein [Helicobacter aurati]RDU70326.1 AMIN domain-containing protein [Helicobacter aurati]
MLIILNILFIGSLYANDNPFMINANQRDFQAQHKNKNKPYLSVESIQLPSNAREIRDVRITYQNIDGTTDSKELKIDKSIDWHYPIKISQQEAIRNIAKRYFSLNDFEFYMEGMNFVVKSTKHRIIRHFIVAEPLTIIVDFSRDGGSAYDGNIGTGEKYFANVRVNARSNSYRLSITLDGLYQYTLKSRKDGIHTITLR